MAKPLGAKSRLIREAIAAHPKTGNTDLAKLIMSGDARTEDGIKVSANDVAQQRIQMKKAGGEPAKKPGRKPGRTPPVAVPAVTAAAPAVKKAGPADLIARLFALADECGGMAELKQMVDLLARTRQ
jgi:hypothetical protein